MKTLSLFNPTFGSDVFDRLDQELGLFAPVSSACFTTPRVDVRETNEAYIMDMDLPGMTEKDINLNLQDRVLTIAYVKEAEKEDEKKGSKHQPRKSICFLTPERFCCRRVMNRSDLIIMCCRQMN